MKYSYNIEMDLTPPNPRTDNCNLCHMAFAHNRYDLGDEDQQFNPGDYNNWADVCEMLKKERGAFLTVKVSMTDHSSQHIYPGEPKDHWDSGVIGFAWVSRGEITKEYGDGSEKSISMAKEMIEAEIAEYDRWRNGEFFCAIVKNENDEVVESCGGFGDEEEAELWAKGIIDGMADFTQPEFDFVK